MLVGYIIDYVQIYFHNFLRFKNMIFNFFKRRDHWSPGAKTLPILSLTRMEPYFVGCNSGVRVFGAPFSGCGGSPEAEAPTALAGRGGA
jgi:hypothetical protein